MPSGLDILSDRKSGLELISPTPQLPSYDFEPYEAATPYMGAIGEAETKYGLPENLLSTLIHTESGFDPGAMSKAGAVGIAQIVPKWHPDVDPTDPMASIDYAGGLLKKHYDEFGDWEKAIAAYNAGRRRVASGEELRPETKDYLKKIGKFKVGDEQMARSGLELLGTEEESTPEPEPELKKPGLRTFLDPGIATYGKLLPGDTDEAMADLAKFSLKGAAKQAGMDLLATSELTMTLASGMLLYLPSKLYGMMALPFGREAADVAEEEIAKLGYQPYTEDGRAAAELVGKGFELFLSPARKVGDHVERVNEEAAYLVEFGAELAEFIMTGGIVRGARARFKPTIEQSAKLVDAKKDLESRTIEKKQKTIEGIPEDSIRAAQQKVLESEKRQAEIEIERMRDSAVKKDLDAKSEEVVDAKAKAEVAEDIAKIEALEKYYEKPIKEITDAEVESFLTKETEVDWFGEGRTEIDMQVGESEPAAITTGEIFRQDPKHTETLTRLFEEKSKSVSENPEVFTAKLLNDMNRYLDGEALDVTAIRDGLSEMAARAGELRHTFVLESDFLQFKETVSETASWARKADRVKIERTQKEVKAELATKLYSGVPLDEAAKKIVTGAKRARNYIVEARALKKFKPVTAAQALREEFNRSFVDRSGNIRRELLNELGEGGYGILQRMYLAKGASSLSARMLDQMRKEVYRGLSKNEKRILDTLIFHDRMAELGKYRTEKDFAFFKEHPVEESIAYVELIGEMEKIPPSKVADLHSRAKAYFEWMKKPLKDMLDAELITQEEFDALSVYNYRKLKLVDIFDKRYRSKVGRKKRTIYDSGVEALARGRDTDIFEPSSEVMALEVFNRAYGRILNNYANKILADLAVKDPTNPFARIRTKDQNIPSGWSRFFYYEDGARKPMYLSPEMTREWIVSNPETSYRLSQMLRYASGSPVLRTFATGINWGFAVANLPRDIMHTWFTARVFENGKWKPVYSPHLPVFALQMTRDQITIFNDALLRKGRYEEYLKEGGGMEFLTHQGRLFQRGRHVERPLDNMYDFLGYFGETTEIMTRLAIRDRVIRRRAKQDGISYEEARKNKDIKREATFAARDYMDFGQGGGIGKAADNALPYLNAAIQGSRGLIRSFKPGSGSAMSSTYKLAQFGSVVVGTYIAASKLAPLTTKALQGNIDMQNNLCVPLGDDFAFEDERGQVRYPYIKMPLDPGQKFFKTFFEACTDKWLGNEVDVDRVVDSLKEQSPVGVSELPPTVSGALGYITNKDFWLNEDIWRKTDEPFGWPKSKEEFIPGRTPQAYIDVGEVTGLSPERMRYMVEELTTSGTLWSYLMGEAYDAALGDIPKSKKETHLAMVLSEMPVIGRFVGVTHPYSQYAGPIDKAEEKHAVDRWIQNRGLDVRVEGYLYNDTVTRKEVVSYMRSFKDKDVYDRLKSDFEFSQATKDLPNRTFWMRLKRLAVEPRAEMYVYRLKRSTPEEREQLNKEFAIVARAGGVSSEDFRKEVTRLRSQ